MIVPQIYRWQPGDTRWSVAGTRLAASGYPDTPTLAQAIADNNPTVVNWKDPALAGQQVVVPYMTQG